MIPSVNSGQSGQNLAQSLRAGYNPVHLAVLGEIVESPASQPDIRDAPHDGEPDSAEIRGKPALEFNNVGM
jgi:hypothetical protein